VLADTGDVEGLSTLPNIYSENECEDDTKMTVLLMIEMEKRVMHFLITLLFYIEHDVAPPPGSGELLDCGMNSTNGWSKRFSPTDTVQPCLQARCCKDCSTSLVLTYARMC
jgi:hypothetical protein